MKATTHTKEILAFFQRAQTPKTGANTEASIKRAYQAKTPGFKNTL